MNSQPRHLLRKALAAWLAAWLAFSPLGTAGAAVTALADAPVLVAKNVPPNLLLDLSVEWPTGVVAAYNDNTDAAVGFECPGRDSGIGVCYFESRTYLGYFNPTSCYDYVGSPGTPTSGLSAPTATAGYFTPMSTGTGTYNHVCSGRWSGNFLNWATMQAIDTFRWALTGGDRTFDTASKTIVDKARHSGQGGYGQFPIKRVRTTAFGAVPAVPPNTVTPESYTNLYVRVHDGSSPFVKFTSGGWDGPQFQVANNSSFSSGGSNVTKTYYLRVEVCKPTLLESNCVAYGSSSKPTGLIQKNADRMRFGVFGYLLDSVKSRAGGVMRAKLKDLGPETINPVGPSVPNARAEFSAADGTFVVHPDSSDAATVAGLSGVSAPLRSGVINYLNKFGKASDQYKSTDTISEMYYESLRYLKNMGSATPQYYSGLTTAMKDGFPVITTWDDPVQYSCQKNYVIMIADVNAWCDYALPGTSITSSGNCSGHSSAISNPIPGLNVTTQVNAVAKLEALPGAPTTLATKFGNTSYADSRGNTWYLAGLAYWANTNDLRPDLTGPTADPTDRVTVQTYMVDVAETGSWSVNNAAGKPVNQMWLAAKYGGFDDIASNGIPASASTWDKNGDGTPDNYFLASRPGELVGALGSVFSDVLAKTESAAGVTFASPQLASGDSVYQVQYTSSGWVGDLFGKTITFDALGNPTTSPSWSARPLLDSMVAAGGWNTTRKIATWNGTAGVPFRIGAPGITAAQQATLGANATIQQEVLNFLHGDRSKEGTPYRVRKGMLGDIVSSESTVVAAPRAPYTDGTNPGYTSPAGGFKGANAARQKMVYVGANDGMLHAFNGPTPGGGQELFAYVPSFLFSGPSSPATPSVDGLAALAQSGYTHRFYVDATPVVADVDFARTGGNPSLVPVGTFNWRTILVGGLGKGGKGLYALDITDPSSMAASETALAAKVLWEFTDADLGFTFGKPVIAKLRQYGWVVMVASGHNNVTGPNPGKGFLYILNAQTGALLQKISTGAGTAVTPSGFAHAAGYKISFADFTVEQVYGGDLLGNVWRFDVSAASGTYPAPEKIAELRDSFGIPQPVTTTPRVEISLNGVTRWVFIGTGKLLDPTDMSDTQSQTMYAFEDGTKSTPATGATLPPTVTFPLQRSHFVPISDAELLTGVTVPSNKIGWLHDLSGVGAGSATERITSDPVANAGFVAWTGDIPSTDACSPGVSSRIYGVDYETGKTFLLNPTLTGPAPYIPTTGIVKLQFIEANGKVELIASKRTGEPEQPPQDLKGAGKGLSKLNWREIIN